ncbi:MAG TPA: AMP-binding protein [Saprospiraceae bacterium]|nr:AMP-binding protein [Saprospiraceae bacterium]
MEVRRIFDLLGYQQKHYPKKSALKERDAIGWGTISTAEAMELVEKMSAALIKLGVEPEDIVLIYTRGSSAFGLLLIQAILQLGATVALVGTDEPDHELKDVLAAAESKIAFVEEAADLKKLRSLATEQKYLQQVFSFYQTTEVPNLEERLVVPMAKQLVELQTLKAAVHEDDPAFFRYAASEKSYQTFSHKEVLSQITDLAAKLHFATNNVVISYQNPYHWLELLLLHAYLAVGAQVLFLKDRQSLLSQLAANRPCAVGSHKSQVDQLRQELTQLPAGAARRQRWINVWAIRIGERFTGRDRMSLLSWVRLAMAEWWRFRHWRQKTGNRLDGIFIAEPLKTSTHNLFEAMGIPIHEQELPARFRQGA